MESSLQTVDLIFEYNLFAIKTIDYKKFLKSNQQEEVIFSVLGNYDKTTNKNVKQSFLALKKLPMAVWR